MSEETGPKVTEEVDETVHPGMLKATKMLTRVFKTMLGLAWGVARARAAGLVTSVILLGIAGAAQGFMTKLVIDALEAGVLGRAFWMGAIFMAIVVGTNTLQGVFTLLQFDLADRIVQEVDRRLMSISAGVAGLDHLERSEFKDKLKLVRDRTYIPNQVLFMFNLISYVVIALVASVVLLGLIHPLLALMPFVTLPAVWFQYRSHKKHMKRHDEIALEDRLAYHYIELATGIKAAKEIRLFGLGTHLLNSHKTLTNEYIKKLFRDRVKRSGVGFVSGAMYGLSLAGSIGFLGYLTLQGRASIGELAMGVQITRMAIGSVQMAAGLVTWTAELAFVGERYLWLFDYESEVKLATRDRLVPPPQAITRGITIEDVRFSYPGTEEEILKGVSLFIPAGTTVALVGENGAGKSTLVKLLCRFYDPTGGRITIDGIDFKDIDLDKWRANAAVSFQDFVKYQLIAREAVGVGELSVNFNGAAVAAAAHQAGATAVINKLPDGVDTQLGRDFEGGIELSEGEWQRIALARGSMRPHPSILILDEPTASLDARAEHEVFERFAEMARPESGPRPVALLVSHRFSTVRMADMIVVLHDGQIEELGSHEELMAKAGRYAELFDLQASRYD
ncbi:MAG: ABC transporter ATP-binding protein/permease [Actinobacteria bacterium]|nr:ABC transporter ATP-binding protein/permease [Actinomycetota bacterium]